MSSAVFARPLNFTKRSFQCRRSPITECIECVRPSAFEMSETVRRPNGNPTGRASSTIANRRYGDIASKTKLPRNSLEDVPICVDRLSRLPSIIGINLFSARSLQQRRGALLSTDSLCPVLPCSLQSIGDFLANPSVVKIANPTKGDNAHTPDKPRKNFLARNRFRESLICRYDKFTGRWLIFAGRGK